MALFGAALGLNVIGWNRREIPLEAPCSLISLEEVVARAHIVSLHLVLDESTRGIVDRRLLYLMRPISILINTVRGALIDQTALLDRLTTGRTAATERPSSDLA